MLRQRLDAGPPPRQPIAAPPWLIGAMIGMTIMTMAGSAIGLGAGLALSKPPIRLK